MRHTLAARLTPIALKDGSFCPLLDSYQTACITADESDFDDPALKILLCSVGIPHLWSLPAISAI